MTEQSKNIVGTRMMKARAEAGMTQDQLSARLARLGVQVDRAGISKIENGSRHVYDYELRAIAKVMEVSPVWLIGESSDN